MYCHTGSNKVQNFFFSFLIRHRNNFYFYRIISQVSGEIVKPKDARPNEGVLKINIEIYPTLLPYIDIPKLVKVEETNSRSNEYNFIFYLQTN